MAVEVLPSALKPWAPELSVLAPELAASLGEPIRRLSQAIGPLTAPPVRGDAEPDGFDGVDRRGPFDRLLLSEWLLAEEIPLEFLRRAADREQTFLKLRRQDPGTSRRTVVLLDAGPDQVGEPRLAHWVALVVLARRARAANAEFRWGVLQQKRLYADVGPDAMLAFRRGATHRRPSAHDLDAWHEQLEETREPAALDDLWIIGGDEACDLGAPSTLSVHEVLDPQGRQLQVLLRRGGREQPLQLPIPGHRDAVRVFRDPVRRPHQAPVTERLMQGDGPMWFSLDGNRLLLVGRNGAQAVHVPPSAHALKQGGRGYTRDLEQTQLVAVGWKGRKFSWVRLDGDRLVDSADRSWPLPTDLHVPEAPVAMYRGHRALWFVDASEKLWKLDFEGLRAIREDVVGFDEQGYIVRGVDHHTHWNWEGFRSTTLDDNGGQLMFGAWGRAHSVDQDTWQVHDTMLRRTQYAGTVHGVLSGRDGWRSTLLGLAPNGVTIEQVGNQAWLVATARSPVSALCVSPKRQHLAWREASGRLVVWDLVTRSALVDVEQP